jgi:plasmid replication initiation protein
MAPRPRKNSERAQLNLFRALGGDFAPRDAQDLMAYPFFSLAKSPRIIPIDFQMNEIAIRVEAVPEHGMATIWDADILIWAASQIVEARDAGLPTSRLMAATPYEILTFIGRGTGARDYERLRAALDRLQSTTVATSLRQIGKRRIHRFSWINEWAERTDANGKSDGIDLILPDWFYRAVLDDGLVLTIDPAYFGLNGGLERWLYRLVRKHAGRQPSGWRFDLRHLYLKSGVLSSFRRFKFDLHDIARRQALPSYRLQIESRTSGREVLTFSRAKISTDDLCKSLWINYGKPVDTVVPSGTGSDVPSGTAATCYQEQKTSFLSVESEISGTRNLESNSKKSNSFLGGPNGPHWKAGTKKKQRADRQNDAAGEGAP